MRGEGSLLVVEGSWCLCDVVSVIGDASRVTVTHGD